MMTPMHLFTLTTLAPACLIAAAAISGGIWVAVALHLALAGYAQMQLLLSGYVQHYRLTRSTNAPGTPTPVAAHHA